ncbi:MAG TPA: hypothetical protein VJN65_05965 [Bacteroidota bacterium]|nr:hypothetical protein [Bacteroidota bacterium]
MLKFLSFLFILSLSLVGTFAQEKEKGLPSPRWDYYGLKPPGVQAELFAPGIISTSDHEHSSPAFSPDGNEVYWSVRIRDIIGREVIRFMQKVNGQWTSPRIASFSDTTSGDLYPTFSLDGKRIYFTSDRPRARNEEPKNRNVWLAGRKGNEWLEPKAIGFDSLDTYGFSLTNDETLYSMAQRSDKTGSYDIYRSRSENGRYTRPQKLRDSINTEHYEDCPYVAPDESFLIFESNRPGGFGSTDLYISFHTTDGSWTAPRNMGSVVNTGSSERFAYLSPDRRYFFFGSNRSGNFDIYWIDATMIDGLEPKPHMRP